MTKGELNALVRAIAVYGERAYRRGFQHGVVFSKVERGVDEEFASEFRHKSYDNVYEVYEGSSKKRACFYKAKPITYRLGIERKDEALEDLCKLSSAIKTDLVLEDGSTFNFVDRG